MDLVLWRHAQAEEASAGSDDLARALTLRGQVDASWVGSWLASRLPNDARVLTSPAVRCRQTANALGRHFSVIDALQPGCTPERLLDAAEWPNAPGPVVLVGHQPVLGQVLAGLLGLAQGQCPVRKGALWWLRARQRDGHLQAVVLAVLPPELLRP